MTNTKVYSQNAEMVRTYFHNSELQRRWAFNLVAKHSFSGDERVLDLGCRDGKISADISRYVLKGHVHGIDRSNEAIYWAQRQFHKMEYPNLSFSVGSCEDLTSIDLSSKFDLIFSCCSLQFSKDPVGDLVSIRRFLKPGGKLIATFPARGNEAWKLANEEIRNSPKWAPYWKDFKPSVWHAVDEWRNFLEEAGYAIQRVEKIETMDPFLDKEELLQWLKGVYPPVIPKDHQNAFFLELIERYIGLDPECATSEGVIFAKFGRIELEASR